MRSAVVAILATLALPFQPAGMGVATARPLDEVVAAGVLRVVVYDDNLPFSWSEHGVAKGIDVAIGQGLARQIGVTAEIILRMPGEDVDDDLRANVWRGPLTGGGVGDVMLHVPVDRELAARNREAVISNPYFEERIALAIDPARIGNNPSFEVFKREKVSVRLGAVADYFLMRLYDGALVPNVAHHIHARDGVDRFLAGETAALMGVRSEIEGLLRRRGASRPFVEPPMPGIVRSRWVVGMAVKDNSRDLGYALGAALQALLASGELERIFAEHGVTYFAPPRP